MYHHTCLSAHTSPMWYRGCFCFLFTLKKKKKKWGNYITYITQQLALHFVFLFNPFSDIL